MTRKKANGNRTGPGIVYVILIELEGRTLVKIGVTHRRIQDLVSEILTSIFMKYLSITPPTKKLKFYT